MVVAVWLVGGSLVVQSAVGVGVVGGSCLFHGAWLVGGVLVVQNVAGVGVADSTCSAGGFSFSSGVHHVVSSWLGKL